MKDSRQKICHIAYQTWPTQCGSVSRLEEVLRSQVRAGMDVFVVSGPFQGGSGEGPTEMREDVRYIRTYLSPEETGFSNAKGWVRRARKFARLFSFAKQVQSICARERPEIIHAHATFLMGFAGWIAARRLRIPLVYEVRSTWEEDMAGGSFLGLQRAVVRALERSAIRAADGVVFISRGLLKHYGAPKRMKTEIIYNSVRDPGHDVGSRRAASAFRIVYIGSLVYYEGLEYLLEAAARLRDQGFNFSISIVGGGERADALKAQCKALRLEELVRFHGRVASDEVGAYYTNADLVVLPRKDLLITNRVAGLKPIEAFAYQTLVLASDVGGMRELFQDKVHGLFFRAGDVDNLVDKIRWAASHREEAARIAEAGHALFRERFTIESMGSRYADFYTRVAEAGSAA